jgi:cystathionine gamma-synthase
MSKDSKRDKRTVVRRSPSPPSVTRPLVQPLSPSVVYQATDADELDRVYEGKEPGFTYAREGNPNAEILAAKLAELEGAEAGLVTSSGMSAVSAVLLSGLTRGDHLVASNQLYGRTQRLVQRELPRFGVEATLVDPSRVSAVEAALRPNTRLILVEVVSNPLLRVADVIGLGSLAQSRGIPLVVDNTFPTPVLLRPLELGASLVLHSVTKMLAGHSDVTLGAVCGGRERLAPLREAMVTWGLNASPWDAWLAERGLNTLELRVRRASATAAALADFLARSPGVQRVFYPGRTDHPDHALSRRLFGEEFGSMVSFELEGGRGAANRFLRALKDIPFAPTLGDVATMVSHPASSSHRGLTAEERAALGIGEGLIRVSVGIEEPAILEEELRRALEEAARR